jgi:hypothetical protein
LIVTQGYGSRNVLTGGFGRRDSLYSYVPIEAETSPTESVPATTFLLDAIPGRGGSQDGAWTETDQDGAWTEYPVNGAYTQDNSYLDEVKPLTFFTKESVPS